MYYQDKTKGYGDFNISRRARGALKYIPNQTNDSIKSVNITFCDADTGGVDADKFTKN